MEAHAMYPTLQEPTLLAIVFSRWKGMATRRVAVQHNKKNGYNQHMPLHMLQIAIKTHTSIYPNTINTLHALYPKVIPSPSTKRFCCHTQMFNCFLLFHSRSFKGRPGCRSPGHVPSPSREGSI